MTFILNAMQSAGEENPALLWLVTLVCLVLCIFLATVVFKLVKGKFKTHEDENRAAAMETTQAMKELAKSTQESHRELARSTQESHRELSATLNNLNHTMIQITQDLRGEIQGGLDHVRESQDKMASALHEKINEESKRSSREITGVKERLSGIENTCKNSHQICPYLNGSAFAQKG